MAATRTITRYRSRPRARHRSKAGTRIPLAVVAGFVPTLAFAADGFRAGGLENAARRVAQRLTGIDSSANVFILKELVAGWGPIMAGFLVHKVASKLGVNRAFARAGIPWIGI